MHGLLYFTNWADFFRITTFQKSESTDRYEIMLAPLIKKLPVLKYILRGLVYIL